MTLYARSDLAYVNVPTSFGGCGQGPHCRPVENGAPVKLWTLDCPPCENHLRSHNTWATELHELPETYDETKVRERDEKMGKLDRENQLAEALIELGKLGRLPEALSQALAPALGYTPVIGQLECPDGHANAAGMKFCGQCGAPLHGTVAKAQIAPPQAPSATESGPPVGLPSNSKMRGMKGSDLAALAEGAGLSTEGTRLELLERLIAAHNAERAAA